MTGILVLAGLFTAAVVTVGLTALVRLSRKMDGHDPALSQYAFGARYLSKGVGDPHDQRKAAEAAKRAKATEERQRKVAAARATAKQKSKPPAKVTRIRTG